MLNHLSKFVPRRLDTEKHLLACLLSGTFEKDLRNEPQPKAPTKALSMRSLRHELPQAESPQSAPRALHYKVSFCLLNSSITTNKATVRTEQFVVAKKSTK